MADRYWVGGTDTWDGTAGLKWSSTSGGAGGASVPTTADNAFFDAASGVNTVTVSGTNPCFSLNTTGFTGTLAGTATPVIQIYKNLVIGSGTTIDGTFATIAFLGLQTSRTCTTNGVALVNVTQTTTASAARAIVFQDSLTLTGSYTLTTGSLYLNSYTLTAAAFISTGSGSRGMDFGSGGTGKMVLTGSGTVLNTGAGGTLSVSGASRTVEPTLLASQTLSSTAVAANAFDLVVPATAGNFTITLSSIFRNVSFADATYTVANQALTIFGSLTISGASPTFTAGANAWSFGATSGTNIITTNGATLDFPVTFNGVGGTWELGSALTIGSSRVMTLTNGTFNSANYSVTVGTFSSSNSNVRTLTMGSSTWTIQGSGASAWTTATSTNMTVNRGTASILMNSASAKTFAGGGRTYPIIVQSAAGTLTISGTNTRFADIQRTVASATTITFTSGQTFVFDDWTLKGVSAAVKTTINSTTTSQHTLSKSSGIVESDFLEVSYSNATGGADWYAGANSTNNGNNTGWIFSAVSSNSGNMFMFF